MVLNYIYIYFSKLADCAVSNDFTRDICQVSCDPLTFAVCSLGPNPFSVRNLLYAVLWGPPVAFSTVAESCKWTQLSFDQV